MSQELLSTPAQGRIFARQSGTRWKAIAYFWAGIALLCIAGAGLFAALQIRADMLQLQLMSNLPALLAIGCFSAAWLARKAPDEIRLFDDRIEIQRRGGNRVRMLSDLSMATVGLVVFTRRRKLKLFDRTGRCIEVVPDSMNGFDELTEAIQQELAHREDEQAGIVRMKKSRRQAVLLAVMSTIFAGLIVSLVLMDRAEARAMRLLHDQGKPATATVLRFFTAPDGKTRRVEYRVTDASGATANHNVEVDPAIWNLLRGARTVPVLAVPSHPEIAQLSFGEIRDGLDLSVRAKLLIYIGGGVMCAFFIIAAILNWRGIDIDLDSKTGRISIKRFGSGR